MPIFARMGTPILAASSTTCFLIRCTAHDPCSLQDGAALALACASRTTDLDGEVNDVEGVPMGVALRVDPYYFLAGQVMPG